MIKENGDMKEVTGRNNRRTQMPKQFTSLLLLFAVPFMACGCGNDLASATAACTNSFVRDRDFDSLVAQLELARDAGFTKQDAFLDAINSGACIQPLPGDTVAGCLDCVQAVVDLVWG